MAAPGSNTFALAAPRRPTSDDVDATLVNDPGPSGPIATGFPYDDQLNTWAKLIKAYGGVVPVCSLEVHFAAGTPSIYAVQACDDTLVAGDFTVADDGDGETTITWAADTFPISASSPEAKVVDTAHGSWLQPTCEPVANGVTVKTRVVAETLTDVNFKVHLF